MSFLPCDAMHQCGLRSPVVSVHLSITIVYCVVMSKDILKLFSPSVSRHTITVFSIANHMATFDGRWGPPKKGVECKQRRKKM